jgi:hypothetical protein
MSDVTAILLHLDAIQEALAEIAALVESGSNPEALLAPLDAQREAVFTIRGLLRSHAIDAENVRSELLSGINNVLMSVQLSAETVERTFVDANRAVAALKDAVARGSEVAQTVAQKIEAMTKAPPP